MQPFSPKSSHFMSERQRSECTSEHTRTKQLDRELARFLGQSPSSVRHRVLPGLLIFIRQLMVILPFLSVYRECNACYHVYQAKIHSL